MYRRWQSKRMFSKIKYIEDGKLCVENKLASMRLGVCLVCVIAMFPFYPSHSRRAKISHRPLRSPHRPCAVCTMHFNCRRQYFSTSFSVRPHFCVQLRDVCNECNVHLLSPHGLHYYVYVRCTYVTYSYQNGMRMFAQFSLTLAADTSRSFFVRHFWHFAYMV